MRITLVFLIICILSLSGIFFHFYSISQNEIKVLKEELTISNKYIEELQSKINKNNEDKAENSQKKKEEEIKKLVDQFISDKKRKKTNIKLQSRELRKELELYEATQRFIPDLIPIESQYSISQDYKDEHKALDYAAEMGTEVFSAAAGVVVKVSNDKYFGNLILVDHLNQYYTLYAHLSKVFVGQKLFVEKGEVIGLVGNSGNSTNPHLHFQITFKDEAIDPGTILK